MFDFKSANLSNLSTADASAFKDILDSILMPNEESSFVLQFHRDGVVFTNKRIIAINIQGIGGKKKAVASFPYRNILAYSMDDSENFKTLDISFHGLDTLTLGFVGRTKMIEVYNYISQKVL